MGRVELRELAEGGVLLVSRALEAGWPRRSLSRRLREEGWSPIRAGVWAQPGLELGLRIRLKAVQLLEPRLVVSHRSAAGLWRIEAAAGPVRGSATLEFVDPGGALRRAGGGVRVHRVPLAPGDTAERQGLRVTTVARTLADLLRFGPRDDALVAVESALTWRRVDRVRRAPLTTLAAVSSALEAPLLGAPLVGTKRARGWLELADSASGSPAETIARLRMHDAGLRPETQTELRTPDGRRRFLDFFFRVEGLAVEIEGYAYHGTREAHRRDVTRFNEILQCPEVRTLLRFTAEDVFHRPTHMIEEIGVALARMRRPGATRPGPERERTFSPSPTSQ